MKNLIGLSFLLTALGLFAQTAEPISFPSCTVREDKDGRSVLQIKLKNRVDLGIRAVEYVLNLADAFGDPITNIMTGGKDFTLTYEREVRPQATVEFKLKQSDIEGLKGKFYKVQKVSALRVAFKDGTVWKAEDPVGGTNGNQRDPGLAYIDLPNLQGQTADTEPAIFLIGISIGYKPGDQEAASSIKKHERELQAALLHLLESKEAAAMTPPQYGKLREDIRAAANGILSGRAAAIYLYMAVVQK